jgi:hypothetical protein
LNATAIAVGLEQTVSSLNVVDASMEIVSHLETAIVFMVGTEAIAISARLYQDVYTGHVEIDPILVNVKIHGKEFCAMSQFAVAHAFMALVQALMDLDTSACATTVGRERIAVNVSRIMSVPTKKMMHVCCQMNVTVQKIPLMTKACARNYMNAKQPKSPIMVIVKTAQMLEKYQMMMM